MKVPCGHINETVIAPIFDEVYEGRFAALHHGVNKRNILKGHY
jgi:hypothetical protein